MYFKVKYIQAIKTSQSTGGDSLCLICSQNVLTAKNNLAGSELNTRWNTLPWFTVNPLTHLCVHTRVQCMLGKHCNLHRLCLTVVVSSACNNLSNALALWSRTWGRTWTRQPVKAWRPRRGVPGREWRQSCLPSGGYRFDTWATYITLDVFTACQPCNNNSRLWERCFAAGIEVGLGRCDSSCTRLT